MQYETETYFRFYLSNNYKTGIFHILTFESTFNVTTSGRFRYQCDVIESLTC